MFYVFLEWEKLGVDFSASMLIIQLVFNSKICVFRRVS